MHAHQNLCYPCLPTPVPPILSESDPSLTPAVLINEVFIRLPRNGRAMLLRNPGERTALEKSLRLCPFMYIDPPSQLLFNVIQRLVIFIIHQRASWQRLRTSY